MSKHASARALYQLCPRHATLVPLALLTCAILLVLGLTRPILYTQQLIFWEQTYSVWTGIVDLWKLGEQMLAVVLFSFSLVFPVIKLGMLTYVWCVHLPSERRLRWLSWVGSLGKWSMLDVFVVAILVVLVKIGALAKVEPRPGVLWFGGAIVASMLTTTYVHHLARNASRVTVVK